MPFPLIPLLSALAPVFAGGAVLGGGAMANAANKKRAQEQMDFQERMSNTSFQRATQDMKLSGINPMLAYEQGGASAPGGAMATMENIMSPAVSSAMHAKRLSEELKNMVEQRGVLEAERSNFWAQNLKNTAEADESRARADLVRTQLPHQSQYGRLAQYHADEAGANALMRRLEANRAATPVGRGLDWVKKFRESLVGSANILMTPGAGRGNSARSQGGRR